MKGTTTVTVLEMGTGQPDGAIPYKLDDLFAKLNEARISIPTEYRDSARVECEPFYEHGESYCYMAVTYERPMTLAEESAHMHGEVEFWAERVRRAESDLDRALKGAAAVGRAP